MTPQIAMTLLCVIESGLWILIGFLFWRRKLQKCFPAMGWYIAIHALAGPIFNALMIRDHPPNRQIYALSNFSLYWTVYILSAVTLFFVYIEVYCSASEGNQELKRLGVIPFRWLAIVLAIIFASSVPITQLRISIIPDLVFSLMRYVSVVGLCLAAYLFISMKALRLSRSSPSFGIVLGFAWQSINDLFISSLITRKTTKYDPIQFVYESLTLAGMCIWVVYFSLPEREAASLVSQANEMDSTLAQLQQ
jgi:hypothetical protein